MRISSAARVLALAAALTSAPALARRTPHLLAETPSIAPEGVVELEQWVWGEGRVPDQPARPVISWAWWAPVVGVSPNLELDFPVQVVSVNGRTDLKSIGMDARYRLFDRLDLRAFQPLIRVGYAYPLSQLAAPTAELNLVLGYGQPDRAQLAINLGGNLAVPSLAARTGPTQLALTASVGGSLPLPGGFRIAAELFDRAPVVQAGSTVLYAGPSLEWTRGPFWVTGGALFGLTGSSPRVFPKLLCAVEL